MCSPDNDRLVIAGNREASEKGFVFFYSDFLVLCNKSLSFFSFAFMSICFNVMSCPSRENESLFKQRDRFSFSLLYIEE